MTRKRTTLPESKAEPFVYNACGHRLISYRLSYGAFFDECEQRSRKGQHQEPCPNCGLYVFPDEAMDRGHADLIDKLPL